MTRTCTIRFINQLRNNTVWTTRLFFKIGPTVALQLCSLAWIKIAIKLSLMSTQAVLQYLVMSVTKS